jgi:hypothetical protein
LGEPNFIPLLPQVLYQFLEVLQVLLTLVLSLLLAAVEEEALMDLVVEEEGWYNPLLIQQQLEIIQ